MTQSNAPAPPAKRAEAIQADAEQDKAPDPRRHYRSPEELREDIELDLAAREELLRQWQTDLDRQLDAEAEGMSASDPISADKESRLANEHRRVTLALEELVAERKQGED